MNTEAFLVALVEHTTADAAIAAAVGERMYPDVAPELSSFPRIVYAEIASEETYSLRGDSNLTALRVQLSAQAKKKQHAVAIRDRLKALYSGYSGPIGTDHPVALKWANVESSVSLVEPPIDGGETPVYQSIIDFRFVI